MSTALSSLTEAEITALEASINTQILSSTNGVTGITATIDADKNLSLNYDGSASVAITPVLTDDGAIKLLETYTNKSTVIAAKKTELKNTADNFAIPSELAQKLEGNAADLKASVKLLIENIPPEKFAYDLGSRALYLKMSDLDSASLPEATEDGATVIPGVKRIKKNGRTALDFTGDASQKVLVDCSPNAVEDGDSGKVRYTNFSKYYRGGILYKDADISLTNDTGIFVYKSNKGDFSTEDSRSSVLDIFKAKDARFSKLTLQSSDKNLYGVIDEELYQKYYDRISLAGEYDAKEALGGETMFNDTSAGYNTNAHTIDVNFAEYLLNRRVDIKNVVVSGSLPTGEDLEQPFGTLINAVVESDMSRFKGLKVKGIVRFNGKSPKSFHNAGSGDLTKLILKQYDKETQYPDGDGIRIDISSLDDAEQIAVLNQHVVSGGSDSYRKGFYYLGVNQKNLQPKSGQVYIFSDGTYEKNTDTDDKEYPDSGYEKDGNGEDVSSLGILLENIKGKIEPYPLKEKVQTTQTPVARANNIKLTPVQKLLVDNQNTIG